MTNPIDSSGRPANTPLQENRSTQQAPDRPAGREGDNAGSRPTTASESERLQAVRESVDQTPEVDRARVEQIREQISNGDYPLDAERIADRFAELEGLLEG